MLFGLEDYQITMLSIFLLLIPAALYIMGVLNDRLGHGLFLAGIGAHLLTIAQRWAITGRLPLAEKHDNISFMALAMALTYWYYRDRKGLRELSIYALPLTVLFLFVALGYRTIDTVSPFMKSPWFYLHILMQFSAFGVFGVSACVGVMYLRTGDTLHENLAYKGTMIGWILFSVAVFMGSIWFFQAYGMYWLWTSKELWLTITWLYYGLYLHARMLRGLSGKPAAVIGIAGFAVAMFAYFGMGTVIPSPPTQF